ncbi:hypothetical protein VCHENC02_1478B, partial [Vibrio harveyi]
QFRTASCCWRSCPF